MAMLCARMRFMLGALLLLTIFSIASPASAQQRNPDNSVNPTASSVKEDALLGELNRISGRCTLPMTARKSLAIAAIPRGLRRNRPVSRARERWRHA